MEARFHKQIQRIRRLNELNNDMHEENTLKENHLTEKGIKEKTEQELKRFKKHVQKKTIEYILNLFEMYTIKFGRIREVSFVQRVQDVRRLSGFRYRRGEDISFPFFQSEYDYLFYYRTIDVILEYGGHSECVDKMDFSPFYKDYSPKELFAHVITFDRKHPNAHHFDVKHPEFILYIDDIKQLFEAVSINYQCEKYVDCNPDTTGYSNVSCDLDGQMTICLSNLSDYEYFDNHIQISAFLTEE